MNDQTVETVYVPNPSGRGEKALVLVTRRDETITTEEVRRLYESCRERVARHISPAAEHFELAYGTAIHREWKRRKAMRKMKGHLVDLLGWAFATLVISTTLYGMVMLVAQTVVIIFPGLAKH